MMGTPMREYRNVVCVEPRPLPGGRGVRRVDRCWLYELQSHAMATFILLTVSAFCVAQESVSPPDGRSRIVPWVESTNSRRSIKIDDLVEGLLIWSEITDTAIVSTSPGGESLYPVLRKRVPGMIIIPGVKTKDLLPRFDSVAGWRAVARQVRVVCDASGQTRVLLENESASKKSMHGKYEIDLARFRKGLQQLPKGIEIIWYPSITGASEAQQQRCERLCRVAAEVLDVSFTDLSLNCPAALRHRLSKVGTQRLDKIAKKPTIPILYCYGPGSRWWMDEEIPGALTHVKGGWVILYPGGKRWPQAARSITRILGESAPSRAP